MDSPSTSITSTTMLQASLSSPAIIFLACSTATVTILVLAARSASIASFFRSFSVERMASFRHCDMTALDSSWCVRACVCACMRVCVCVCACVHTCVCACMCGCVCACMRMCMRVCVCKTQSRERGSVSWSTPPLWRLMLPRQLLLPPSPPPPFLSPPLLSRQFVL